MWEKKRDLNSWAHSSGELSVLLSNPAVIPLLISFPALRVPISYISFHLKLPPLSWWLASYFTGKIKAVRGETDNPSCWISPLIGSVLMCPIHPPLKWWAVMFLSETLDPISSCPFQYCVHPVSFLHHLPAPTPSTSCLPHLNIWSNLLTRTSDHPQPVSPFLAPLHSRMPWKNIHALTAFTLFIFSCPH